MKATQSSHPAGAAKKHDPTGLKKIAIRARSTGAENVASLEREIHTNLSSLRQELLALVDARFTRLSSQLVAELRNAIAHDLEHRRVATTAAVLRARVEQQAVDGLAQLRTERQAMREKGIIDSDGRPTCEESPARS